MGVMPGKTAIARSEYGKGRVICYSPHPEKPFQPVFHLIENGVRWVAGKEPIEVTEAEWQNAPSRANRNLPKRKNNGRDGYP